MNEQDEPGAEARLRDVAAWIEEILDDLHGKRMRITQLYHRIDALEKELARLKEQRRG